MDPVVADIRKEWSWVEFGINEILNQFHWFEYRAEDVYAACVNGSAVLYKTDQGFAIFVIETHPLTEQKTFLCWIAGGKGKGLGLVKQHFDFFCEEGRKIGCTRFKTRTAIDGLDSMFTGMGFRCDMRDFSYDLADKSALGE